MIFVRLDGFDFYFGYNMWDSPFYNATNVWENFKPAGLIKDYNTDVFTRKAMDFMRESMAASQLGRSDPVENPPWRKGLRFHKFM